MMPPTSPSTTPYSKVPSRVTSSNSRAVVWAVRSSLLRNCTPSLKLDEQKFACNPAHLSMMASAVSLLPATAQPSSFRVENPCCFIACELVWENSNSLRLRNMLCSRAKSATCCAPGREGISIPTSRPTVLASSMDAARSLQSSRSQVSMSGWKRISSSPAEWSCSSISLIGVLAV
ncbi:MAG: hypothetical protein C5S43_00985 [Candidatus Methanocomedens sp.]|nr:MAG: hypothetical protein C5S43_00985 [ANME-2 cluster archaeon]